MATKELAVAACNLIRLRAHIATKVHEAAHDKRELESLQDGHAVAVMDYAQKLLRQTFRESLSVSGWVVGVARRMSLRAAVSVQSILCVAL